jgi:hypothetical protein
VLKREGIGGNVQPKSNQSQVIVQNINLFPYHSPRCSVPLPKAAPDSDRRCLGQPRRLKQPGMEILIDSQLGQKLILLPSGYVKIAIEHGHIKFVSFPIFQWWIFPSFFVTVYQRVYPAIGYRYPPVN